MKENWLEDNMYNYHVPMWKRRLIKWAFKISPNLGVKVLWKLAPFACVG